jgi:uncharacterized protein
MSVFAVEYVYDADATDLITEHRPAHRAWLAELLQAGRLLTSGPFVDGSGALLIFTAADEDELNETLKQDPFASVGVISGMKTTEWNPVIGLLADQG